MSAHVIVVGNEKGGSGKSTTAFHLAIALLYKGFRVATIDVDSRQQTLTKCVVSRRKWARDSEADLPHTTHFHLPPARSDSIRANHQAEFELFRQAVMEGERDVDFLVIDTPGFDSNLSRLAHSLADTLVSPLNDSLIDLDVLARIDPLTGEAGDLAHYALLAQRARKERLAVDGRTIDWVLVRNRISMLSSRNMRLVQKGLDQVATRLGARVADGIAERVIFRSLYAFGLTVFDPVPAEMLAGASIGAYKAPRMEFEQLMAALNLPVTAPFSADGGWQQASAGGSARHGHMSA